MARGDDMKKGGLRGLHTVSLRKKILFGFLFSIVPMLAIVIITYLPARDVALKSSHRQMELVSGGGQEKLELFFRDGAENFATWTEADVYGMAIEFNALDELVKQFALMQRVRPEFYLLLITDEAGVVIEEGRRITNHGEQITSLKGETIEEVDFFRNISSRSMAIVPSPFSKKTQQGPPSILYGFPTSDSSGKINGYLLAYKELSDVSTIAEATQLEMKKSGLMASRVVVMNSMTEAIIGSAGEDVIEWQQLFASSLQNIIHKSIIGEVGVFTSGDRTEHIVYRPLQLERTQGIANGVGSNGLNLYLLISVDENEIMGKVHKTLTAAVIIGGAGILAILIIAYFTVTSIIGPISSLVKVLQQYGRGDSKVRAQIVGNDEIGYLSREFNAMLEQINSSGDTLRESESRYRMLFDGLQEAVSSKNYVFRFIVDSANDDLTTSMNSMLETLENADTQTKEQDWLKTGLTHLGEKISGEQKVEELCENAISFIADYMGAQIGTLFVKIGDDLNSESYSFELKASYAFRMRKGLSNRYLVGEGLIGQAALEKKTILFSDIPEDYIQIESSLGASPPVNILIIPLVYEGDVKGVIELGTSFVLSPRYLSFADQVSSMIAVAIHAATANDSLKTLLDQTSKQSEVLRKQQDELQKANSELEEQTQVLKESEARLQVQQEELQASNEEMEEKNQLLEEQKRENEEKNRNLKEKQKEIENKAHQLELATKYKSEFLSNMSHELRTPLNSILLLAKMLSENEEKNLTDDQMESAEAIHRGGQTLLHLINDILDLAKIEAGRVDLSISHIQPQTITKNFTTEFNHLAKSKGLDFITEVEDGLPQTLLTDVHRLEQIVRNLLGNAFKFTEHGSVTLRIGRPEPTMVFSRTDLDRDEAVTLSVIDSGPGIHKEKLNLIFEAFRQVDGSISRRHGGTGLGLSISKELAHLIGGEISVKSEVGQGAVFTLIIPQAMTGDKDTSVTLSNRVLEPLSREHERAVAAGHEVLTEELEKEITATEGRETPGSATRRMLIIEDDPEFSSILSNFFKKSGYETIVAPTGELGIKYAIEQNPTAVILDIGLPGIDGWTVLNELKNNPDTRHIPVHIMSAYDESYEGLKKGAVGYLTKPVSIEGLRSALIKIEHVLENQVKELLVVEDDRDLRNHILKLMGTRDICVTTAETGKETLELLKTNRFDCMVLDLGLPDISGFTLLDEIEKDVSIGKLPVIIYTGRDLTREETERLEKYSASIVLKSAFSMERLLDETALFMHRVEEEMPESHRKIIQDIREKDSSIKGKEVLLVDDDMRNAFALSKFLKSKGVNVTIADNGKKALEVLHGGDIPDIVLMDIMMPVMDGYEAMKEIRKIEKYRDLPILALTAKAMETDREECIRCGANDYLSKPIDTQKLLSMLRIWMY